MARTYSQELANLITNEVMRWFKKDHKDIEPRDLALITKLKHEEIWSAKAAKLAIKDRMVGLTDKETSEYLNELEGVLNSGKILRL